MEITPREAILKKVRQALLEKTKNPFPDLDLDSPLFKLSENDPAIEFALNLNSLGGKFVYCANKYEYIEHLITLMEQNSWSKVFCHEEELQKDLTETGLEIYQDDKDFDYVEACITTCEALIYRSGTLLVSNKQQNRKLVSQTPSHIVVAFASQLVRDIKDGFLIARNKYGRDVPSWMMLISGPSRTADIEKTPVQGVHGAKELYVFLIDDRKVE